VFRLITFLSLFFSIVAWLTLRETASPRQITLVQNVAKSMMEPEFKKVYTPPPLLVPTNNSAAVKIVRAPASVSAEARDQEQNEVMSLLQELKKTSPEFEQNTQLVKNSVDCSDANDFICAWIALSIPLAHPIDPLVQQRIADQSRAMALEIGPSLQQRLRMSLENNESIDLAAKVAVEERLEELSSIDPASP
jgi:hypothetical protein